MLMWRDKRDRLMLVLAVVLSIGWVEVSNAAGWSDQTLMAGAFGVGLVLMVVWFAYELRHAPRIQRRR